MVLLCCIFKFYFKKWIEVMDSVQWRVLAYVVYITGFVFSNRKDKKCLREVVRGDGKVLYGQGQSSRELFRCLVIKCFVYC